MEDPCPRSRRGGLQEDDVEDAGDQGAEGETPGAAGDRWPDTWARKVSRRGRSRRSKGWSSRSSGSGRPEEGGGEAAAASLAKGGLQEMAVEDTGEQGEEGAEAGPKGDHWPAYGQEGE